MKEVKIIDSDGYEQNIDEIASIVIKNNLGRSFEFKIDEIKSFEIVEVVQETIVEPDINDPTLFPADGYDAAGY